MKKYLFIGIILFSSYLLFADGKDELKNIVNNISSKTFKQAGSRIEKLQEEGGKYVAQDKYYEALESYRKAVVIAEKLYGKNSTAVASVYTAIGVTCFKKGEKIKAADNLVIAAEIYKKSAGGMFSPKPYYILNLQAARIYYFSKETKKASSILSQLENNIKQIPQERKSEFYYLLANCKHAVKKYDEAVKYCQKAIQESCYSANPPNDLAEIHNIWSSCLVEQGKRKQAIKAFQKTLQYAIKAQRPDSFIGQTLLNAGINYIELDDYHKAKKYIIEALDKFQNTKEDILFWRGLAYLYLARNARFHKKWQEAEVNYEKAAELLDKYLVPARKHAQNNQNKESSFIGLCLAYKWLQTCFYQNKTQMKALAIYPKLKKISYINNKSRYLADIYPPLIANYIDLKKYEQAKLIIIEGERATDLSDEKLSKESNLATLCYLEGKILHLTGHRELAIEKCERALTLFKKIYPNSTKAKLISQRLKEWEK